MRPSLFWSDRGQSSGTMNNCSSSPASVSETSWTEIGLVIGYLSILSVTGSIGNLLVLYVFARRKDALVSTLFILVLAEVDFITCLVVMPYTAYMEYVDFRTHVDLVCKLYLFLITFNIPFSALIMAAIAVDRYLCICHPFLRAMTIGRAKVLVVALGLFAAGQGLCVSLIYGVYLPYDDDCPMSQLGDSYPLVNTGPLPTQRTRGQQGISVVLPEALHSHVPSMPCGGDYFVCPHIQVIIDYYSNIYLNWVQF